MPTFPSYRGELPECLNPFNPWHYVLLTYWIFFRPSAIKYYLYQANPSLYRVKMGGNIFRIWYDRTFLTIAMGRDIFRIQYDRAFRNIYLLIPGVVLLLSLLIDLPFILLTAWVEDIPVDWLRWSTGSIVGLVAGTGFGCIFGMMLCVLFDVAAGVALGVVFSVNSGIATSLWVGASFGTKNSILRSTKNVGTLSLSIIALIIVVFLMGLGVSLVFSKAFGWKIGTGISVVFTALVGGAISILIYLTVNVKMGITFGVAFGIMGGLVVVVFAALLVIIGFKVLDGFSQGVWLNVGFGAILGVIFNRTAMFAVWLGALRILFYPFQFVFAVCNKLFSWRHPIEWDEMTIFPLPHTKTLLMQRLQQDETRGLCFMADVGRNPFRQAVLQKAIYKYVHTHRSPVHFLYSFFSIPELNEYLFVPLSQEQWENASPVYVLFLRILALQSPKLTSFWFNFYYFFPWLTWQASFPLTQRHRTPLTNFVGLLYELEKREDDIIDTEDMAFLSDAKGYKGLIDYPGGEEIVHTFDAITRFLSYQQLADITQALETVSTFHFQNPVRPSVITALKRLGDVGAEIQTYQDSTSRANRLSALARAADALKTLDESVQNDVMVPERYLLRRIIRQWQALMIETGGELGRAELTGPVANPYIAGNPVQGDLFVGREDILRRLEELWSSAGQKPSVVLYGHRRMGKSSILHNLGKRFGKETILVDFNMQRVGVVANTGQLLHNLSLAMFDEIEAAQRTEPFGEFTLSEPEEERFLQHDSYTAFNRFLKKVDAIRGEKRFIITIDEFELIEDKIQRGKLDKELLDYWRGLIQTHSWFVVAFAGLHTLQEMTQDYWNPLFGSVTRIPVSFLQKGAARRLITQPSSDFSLDYDEEAIEEIARLTNCQPYLIQLICHCLVTRFNRQMFEDAGHAVSSGTTETSIPRQRRFSLADVDAVMNSPEFFRDGDAYFSGVWAQARDGEAAEQHKVLQALATSETGLSTGELHQKSALPQERLLAALQVLQRHDVVRELEGKWQFTVELMRRWVAQENPA